MSISIRFKRGATAAISALTEEVGSLVIDTTEKNIRLHDGTTAGGVKILNETQVNSAITSVTSALDERLQAIEAKNLAETDKANSFSGDNTFSGSSTFSGAVSLGSSATAVTPDSSSDGTAVATKAYVDSVGGNYIPTSEKGVAEGVATLDSEGKLVTSQLPALSITSVQTVASIAERDKLTNVQEGDIVIVTAGADGQPHTYIHNGAETNYWTEIVTNAAVISVAGKTGVVTLEKSDVGLGNVDNYATATQAQAQDITSTTSNEVFMTALRTKEMLNAAGLTTDASGNVVIDLGTVL